MAHKSGKGFTGMNHSNEAKNKISLANSGRSILRLPREFYIEDYLNKEKSVRQIGRELNVSSGTVWLQLVKFNIKRRKRSNGAYWTGKKNPKQSATKKILFLQGKIKTTKLNLPDSEIIDLYTISNISMPKLSIKFGCSITAIHNLLIRNNIKRKSNGFYSFGKKFPNRGVPCTEEKKMKLRISSTGRKKSKSEIEKYKKWRKTFILPKKDTSIELAVQGFLKQLNVHFVTHKYIKIKHGYQCDVFIPSLNLVIECDGDYWHGNPNRCKNGVSLTQKQLLQREKDNIRTRELLESGYNVIRLWESEIKAMKLYDFMEVIQNFNL